MGFTIESIIWNAPTTLKLIAHNKIEINKSITATSSSGKLALEYGQGSLVEYNESTYKVNATINLKDGYNFSTKLGSDAPTKEYLVINSLGFEGGSTGSDLQGINGNLSGNYALGSDIDAGSTAGWNGGLGFSAIGGNSVNGFSGNFEGLGHKITSLTINNPNQDYQGLFAKTYDGSSVNNLNLIDFYIKGKNNVGTLSGLNLGKVSDIYSSGFVSGNSVVGGLVGDNQGLGASIKDSNSVTKIFSKTYTNIGGLVGTNSGIIVNSFWKNTNSTNLEVIKFISLNAPIDGYSSATNNTKSINPDGNKSLIGSPTSNNTSEEAILHLENIGNVNTFNSSHQEINREVELFEMDAKRELSKNKESSFSAGASTNTGVSDSISTGDSKNNISASASAGASASATTDSYAKTGDDGDGWSSSIGSENSATAKVNTGFTVESNVTGIDALSSKTSNEVYVSSTATTSANAEVGLNGKNVVAQSSADATIRADVGVESESNLGLLHSNSEANASVVAGAKGEAGGTVGENGVQAGVSGFAGAAAGVDASHGGGVSGAEAEASGGAQTGLFVAAGGSGEATVENGKFTMAAEGELGALIGVKFDIKIEIDGHKIAKDITNTYDQSVDALTPGATHVISETEKVAKVAEKELETFGQNTLAFANNAGGIMNDKFKTAFNKAPSQLNKFKNKVKKDLNKFGNDFLNFFK